MACGCKDKEKDAAIIAEVERRKGNNYTPFEDTFFLGNLSDISLFYDVNEIVNIENLQNDNWRITLKKTLSVEKV